MAQSFQDEVICPVCLDYFSYPTSIECGHTFCLSCIFRWSCSAAEVSFTCPECRGVSQRANLRPDRQLGNLARLVQRQRGLLERTLSLKKEMLRFREDMTLDPSTAHSYLVLSEDLRSVRCGFREEPLPNTPERYDETACVLGSSRFTHGRHFWEVEVEGKTEWDIGVTLESGTRKGDITLSPQEGFWAICLRERHHFWASTSPQTPLYLRECPNRVAIFLDIEAGIISFYDVSCGSHIFTFSDTFSEPLRPFFCVELPDGGENVAPLTICPGPVGAWRGPGHLPEPDIPPENPAAPTVEPHDSTP
ncbi:zinc finger protein RFP-like [Ornithorhynchus anatinus]|uniref:Uncharacterized protein n=1 Tax=Ornithorhynchus anatinus TaxID=9258 RepID=F7CME7_ORNAN|nr:zinc finger protein RFP-like [Ornithorhynchus anatinus]